MTTASASIHSLPTSHHSHDQAARATSFDFSPQLRAQLDERTSALWLTWKPSGIPCFNIDLLRDLHGSSSKIQNSFSASDTPLRYMVVQSAVPGVFNLGGDLAYFERLIEARDRAALYEYARLAVEVAYRSYSAHGIDGVTSIALLEGTALGGGLESALTCDVVIAEKHVKAGFPEVLFNMFPGMGGLSFLSRRTSRQTVNELTRSGRLYSAQELFDMGVIDLVVDSGAGPSAVQQLIRQRERQVEAHVAMNTIDRLLRPVTLQELNDIVALWVDAALGLSQRGLQWMRRLHQQQTLAFGAEARREPASSLGSSLAA